MLWRVGSTKTKIVLLVVLLLIVAGFSISFVVAQRMGEIVLWNGEEHTIFYEKEQEWENGIAEWRVMLDGELYFVESENTSMNVYGFMDFVFGPETNGTQNYTSLTPFEVSKPVSENITNSTPIPTEESYPLASTINGKSLDNYSRTFLAERNNYATLPFNAKKNGETLQYILRDQYEQKKPRGFITDEEKYVIDLITCEYSKKKCAFRINAIGTGLIGVDEEFTLKEGLTFVMKQIEFDTCGGARFCDTIYDAYDEVEVEIK